MSKGANTKPAAVDVSHYCKSTFSLTFAIELLGIDVWHDCNEGWLDLGPSVQGLRIQYQLYPGQSFELDILIWPHVAKIWYGGNYGWVRTWQFLERRFLTFSIRHIFPVRVAQLQTFTVTINPTFGLGSLGSNAKNDKNFEVYLPPLKFGDLRYFAPVAEREETMSEYIKNLIWNLIVNYIPISPLDGVFDIPGPVHDVRHQDTIMYYVKEAILNNIVDEEPPEPVPEEQEKRDTKVFKDKLKEKEKKKPTEAAKVKFEINLSGDSILAGVGRVVPFETIGDRPNDLGEIIAIISSSNLPAQDDQPIIFVNVENLSDVPLDCLRNLRVSQVYTTWTIGEEKHNSEPQNMKGNKTNIKFNDHHALPLQPDLISKVTAVLLEKPFQVQLRGIRCPLTQREKPKFFGYKKGDQNFDGPAIKLDNEDTDFLIAVTKIDAQILAKGMSNFLRGDYSLYPPNVCVEDIKRDAICSNDVNRIKLPLRPNIVVPTHVVLEAQMTLEVSMGLVGCKAKKLSDSFARLYTIVKDSEIITAVLKNITEINEEFLQSGRHDEILTGFAIDVGNLVVLYVEGPSNGEILKIWEMTEDYYPKMKPVFSSSNRYANRIYPTLPKVQVQFNTLKMYVPLSVILACPPVYVRPALPYPTRSAVLKLGRLIAGKFREAPPTDEMPSIAELNSFKLELCVAPRPVLSSQMEENKSKDVPDQYEHPISSTTRINWDKHDARTYAHEE